MVQCGDDHDLDDDYNYDIIMVMFILEIMMMAMVNLLIWMINDVDG